MDLHLKVVQTLRMTDLVHQVEVGMMESIEVVT